VHAAAPKLAAARVAAASAWLATAAAARLAATPAARVAATAAAAATIGTTAAGATAAAAGHRLGGWHLLVLGPRRLPALLCRLGLHVVAHAAMTPGRNVIGNLEMLPHQTTSRQRDRASFCVKPARRLPPLYDGTRVTVP